MLDDFADLDYLLARLQLALFMLGMGATLVPADFVHVLRAPRYLLVGLGCQFVVAPFLALILSRWWQLDPGIAIGLFLIAALPGGQMSKLFTYLARGSIALSISLTACGTVASLLIVPLLLHLAAARYFPEGDFVMPVGTVVGDVALYLLLPLVVGMTVRRLIPRRSMFFSRFCIRLGLALVVVMIAGWAARGQIQLTEFGWKAPAVVILFCVAGMQLSLLPFRLLRWPKPDAVAVGIEVTMRNMNLALLLKALLFPFDNALAKGVLFVILFYGGTAIVAGCPLCWRYRRMAKRQDPFAVTSKSKLAA